MGGAVRGLIPDVEPCSRSSRPNTGAFNVGTVCGLSGPSLCEVDADGWLRGSKVACVKGCVVWPPPITTLGAPRNKMSAV